MAMQDDDYAEFRLTPQLTSDDMDDGAYGRRVRRLLVVSGFLRARLSEREFASIHRLHDHEGMLTVGIEEPRGSHRIDADKIDREVKAAWEAVNEVDAEVHYTARW